MPWVNCLMAAFGLLTNPEIGLCPARAEWLLTARSRQLFAKETPPKRGQCIATNQIDVVIR